MWKKRSRYDSWVGQIDNFFCEAAIESLERLLLILYSQFTVGFPRVYFKRAKCMGAYLYYPQQIWPYMSMFPVNQKGYSNVITTFIQGRKLLD